MVYVAEPWGASSDEHMLFMCEDEFHGQAETLHYMQSGVTCSTLSVCRLMFQRDFTCLQEDYNCRLMFQRDFTCLQEDYNRRLIFQRDFTCLQEDYNRRLMFQRDFTCLQEDYNRRLMFQRDFTCLQEDYNRRLMFQRDFTCLQEDENCRLMFQRDFTCLQEDENWRLMFQRDFTCLQEDYNRRLMFQRDFTCLQEDENWRLMFHLLLELKIRLCFSPDFPPCLSSFGIFPPVFFYCHDSLISVQVPPPAVFLFFLIFNLALRPLGSPLICSQLEDAGSLNDVDGWSLCPARSAVTARWTWRDSRWSRCWLWLLPLLRFWSSLDF